MEARALDERADVRQHDRAPAGIGVARAARPCPPSGRVRPSSIRISVVLPEPLGPSMPSTEPTGTSRSIPSTATVAPNTLRRPLIRAAATAGGATVDGERHRDSVSDSTCSGTAPAAMRPSSVTIAVADRGA